MGADTVLGGGSARIAVGEKRSERLLVAPEEFLGLLAAKRDQDRTRLLRLKWVNADWILAVVPTVAPAISRC